MNCYSVLDMILYHQKTYIMRITSFLSIIFAAFLLLPHMESIAKDHHTEANPGETTFRVLGNCGMCKDRIERAAYTVRGVRYAEWDVDEQMITVRYRPNRTNQEEIERAIAKAGHDTENFLADDDTHANLHHCCIYPRDPEMLENNRRYDEE